MRLIDADALIARITKTEERCKAGNLAQYVMNAVKSEIDREPTAYDAEKVVEQLEKQREDADNWSIDADDYFSGKEFAYGNAINIVKRGGVE